MTKDPQTYRRQVTPSEVEALRRGLQNILGKRNDIIAAYLHGTAARNEPAKDVDIAILYKNKTPEFRDIEQLAATIEAQKFVPGLEVDLRSLEGTSPRFRFNVLHDAQLLFESDPQQRIRFEARSLGEWIDFKPTWEKMRAAMYTRWTDG